MTVHKLLLSFLKDQGRLPLRWAYIYRKGVSYSWIKMKNILSGLRGKYIFAAVVALILVVVFFTYRNKITKTQTSGDVKVNTSPQISTVPTPNSYKDAVINNLSTETKQELIDKKNEILPKLPIYIKEFKTSGGITTRISILSSQFDPPETLRVEIYGVNYLDGMADENDINYIAFTESLEKAFEEINKAGGDSSKLRYIFYSKELIHEIAYTWAIHAGLINY